MADRTPIDNADAALARVASAHTKPSLTVAEQIAHLRSQGVTFDLMSEEKAAEYLTFENSYLRTRSYRKLYPRRPDGTYIGLDFAALKGLSSLDRQLRSAFLGTCIDVEHFAKMKALRMALESNEDGYVIVSDFLQGLNHRERERLMSRLKVRIRADRRDEYAGDLIEHYISDMPMWVFLEVLDFGQFVNFYLFCSQRWENLEMRQEHYALKSAKALRNACAHNAVIVPGLSSYRERAGYQTNPLIASSLTAHGMRNTKSRRTKLSNLRLEEMSAALYCLSAFGAHSNAVTRDGDALRAARSSYDAIVGILPHDGSLTSYLDFLWRLVDIWLPEQV